MVTNVGFDAALLATTGYALWRGGSPERCTALAFIAAVIFTRVAVSSAQSRFSSVEVGIFCVDVVMLFGLTAIALRAERFWTLWVAALQLIGAAGHAVKLVDPTLIRWAYAFALAFWSYPMMLVLAVGTWNHQRRLARDGVDKSWSNFSGRWGLGRRPGPPAS
jgi:hypothetical protein